MQATSAGFEQLEQSSSIPDFLLGYNAALGNMTKSYLQGLDSLFSYKERFQASGLSTAEFRIQQQQDLETTFSNTTRRIYGLFSTLPEILDNLPDLSSTDRGIFEIAQTIPSLKSSREFINERVSNRGAKLAIRIAFNQRVHRSATDTQSLASAQAIVDEHASDKNTGEIMHISRNSRAYRTARLVLTNQSITGAQAIIEEHVHGTKAKIILGRNLTPISAPAT